MPYVSKIFLFSGQGSHHPGMGKALYSSNRVFREHMQRMDLQVKALTGHSVIQQLYPSTSDERLSFDRTLLTHPAIFMVEYALAQALQGEGVVPDAVLGASLGSFAAAAVAGYIRADDALRAVVEQATLLETYCEPGGMIAILADRALFAESFLSGASELAAVNFPAHFVVAAPSTRLAQIEAELRRRKVNCQRLPVAFAFHSRWIDSARAPFTSFMKTIPVMGGSLPLICCDQGTLLSHLPVDYFWNVIRRPIRFHDTIARLAQGSQGNRYIDLGPSGTLATFLKYSRAAGSEATAYSVLSPYGHDSQSLSSLLLSLGMIGNDRVAAATLPASSS